MWGGDVTGFYFSVLNDKICRVTPIAIRNISIFTPIKGIKKKMQ